MLLLSSNTPFRIRERLGFVASCPACSSWGGDPSDGVTVSGQFFMSPGGWRQPMSRIHHVRYVGKAEHGAVVNVLRFDLCSLAPVIVSPRAGVLERSRWRRWPASARSLARVVPQMPVTAGARADRIRAAALELCGCFEALGGGFASAAATLSGRSTWLHNVPSWSSCAASSEPGLGPTNLRGGSNGSSGCGSAIATAIWLYIFPASPERRRRGHKRENGSMSIACIAACCIPE